MSAPLVSVSFEHPSPRNIERAASVLSNGGLIAYPTDTQYAVGCDVESKKGLDRLYELKGGDRKKTFAFLCPDLSDVARYAHVTNFAYRFMKHLTPGPYTFVLEATKLVPKLMSNKQKEVGIRVPDSPVAVAIVRALGRPMVTTTATDHEGNAFVDPRDIKDELGHFVDLILDAGVVGTEPSTVVSLRADVVSVLRMGKGPLDE